MVGIKLYRLRKAFKNMNATVDKDSMSLIVRVGIFSVYSFLSLVSAPFILLRFYA